MAIVVEVGRGDELGILGHRKADRRLVLALAGQVNIEGDVDVGRAGVAAGHRQRFPIVLRLVLGAGVRQGTGGTDLDAGPAEAAVGVLQGPVESRADDGIEAAVDEADGPDPPRVSAHLDAAPAEDTEIIITLNKWFTTVIHWQFFIFVGKEYFLNSDIVNQLL